MLRSTARPFPTTGGVNADGTPVPRYLRRNPSQRRRSTNYRVTARRPPAAQASLDTGAAVLAALAFDLTVARSGNGTITSSPTGIDCGTNCKHAYAPGTLANLTAAPDPNAPGGSYVAQAGATTARPLGPRQCTLTMNTAKSVAAFGYVGSGSASSAT